MDEILASRKRQRRYPWMPYVLWEADGVIFGHFLDGVVGKCTALVPFGWVIFPKRISILNAKLPTRA
jgi:hypothetical protein